MAKYPHRIFEMYESRNEASRAVAPKAEKPATDATAPETWRFQHLAVSRSAGVTLVEFKEAETFGEDTVGELGEDFAQLAELLGRDSKVVVDLTGLVSFRSAFVDALILFHKKLQTKGSRLALCGLEPAARESFFAVR